MAYSFWVAGKPRGKQRARTFYDCDEAEYRSITPKQTKAYEKLVAQEAWAAGMRSLQGAKSPFLWKIHIDMFVLDKTSPEGAYCGRMPDNDNTLKAVLDGLSGFIENDRQAADVDARKWAVATPNRQGVGVMVSCLGPAEYTMPTDPAVISRRDLWLKQKR